MDNDLTKIKSLIKDAKKLGLKEEMINVPDITGWTPLMIASGNNNLPIVKLLIKEGSIVSNKNNYGQTAAHWAAITGSNDVLRHLLIGDVNVDEKGLANHTLLHTAAFWNCHSTVDLLLNEFNGKSFINDNSNVVQETPLIAAIRGIGDLEMVKMLIGAGADKEKVDGDNETALDKAKRSGNMDIVNYLKKL